MSNKMTRAMQKELNSRVKALPGDYQVVFHEISKYLYQFASSDAGVVGMQFDILDMFETGAQEGKGVLEIVGNDVIGFCDGILGASPEDTWIGKMKAALNQSIHKKLAKRKSSGNEHFSSRIIRCAIRVFRVLEEDKDARNGCFHDL